MSTISHWMIDGDFDEGLDLPNPTVVDELLSGDNGGVRQLFDLAFTGSWPTQGAPSNGAVINDLTSHDNDLIAELTNPSDVSFEGGGFDFTGVASRPNNVLSASGKTPLAGIHAATNDYFLVCGYYKLPAAWNSNATIQPIFSTALSPYNTPAVDMLIIAMHNTTGMSFRRQTNGGTTIVDTSVPVTSDMYGKVAQVAYYRNASGVRASIRTSLGLVTSTAAVGSNNTGDYSANRPRWGIVNPFTLVPPNRTDLRVFRGFVDDLNLDTRDPAALLEADWSRNANRFS